MKTKKKLFKKSNNIELKYNFKNVRIKAEIQKKQRALGRTLNPASDDDQKIVENKLIDLCKKYGINHENRKYSSELKYRKPISEVRPQTQNKRISEVIQRLKICSRTNGWE